MITVKIGKIIRMQLSDTNNKNDKQKNVLGTDLELCSCAPKTGFFRDGFCNTSKDDLGLHTVCAVMTDEFLEFTKMQGNDLSSVNNENQFPGLKANDKWCICVSRWIDAARVGKAPPVILKSCHQSILNWVSLEELKKYTYQ